MDSLITAAARALAAGDVLGALNRVALRDDPPALALRGIAMARLGDLPRAKALLRGAARAFGAREAMARARCVVAEAEVALVSRDLGWPDRSLAAARAVLEQHGDHANAAHAGHLQVRRLLLVGRLAEAEALLADLSPSSFPPATRAAHELVVAGLAMRRLRTQVAREALARAQVAAERAGIAGLVAEVEVASLLLQAPAARRITPEGEKLLRLDEVEALFAGDALVVDACRYAVRSGGQVVALASRPVLFTLARALAEAGPGGATRDALVQRAFRGREADESYRVRLRVEIGRLRSLLRGLAEVHATQQGFRLQAPEGRETVILAPPVEEAHAEVLAFLADGESWSSSGLALALGASQRTVQRALEALQEMGKVQPVGQGRSRRWVGAAALPGFTTTLLLPASLPAG